MRRFWIRRSPYWLDIWFDPGGRLRIQSTDSYWLWISWGYRAEVQFTINRWWTWYRPIIQGGGRCGFKSFKFLWFSLTTFF